jgi:hypothetical protein
MIWKEIVGTKYFVSSTGAVRSPRKELSLVLGQVGYHVVAIHGKPRYVHRLVAAAFIGPPPFAKAEVNHKNGIKTDNRIENLEWVDRRENIAHARRTGLLVCARGEKVTHSKLNADAVRKIRGLLAEGVSHREIARRFNISRGPVGAIARGHLWKHVED